jgi:hypothetical protein
MLSYGISALRQCITRFLRQDFDDDIMNNAIRLLHAIKEHALNHQDKKYPMLIIMDAFRAFSTTKQKEGNLLQDFTKRFKVAKWIWRIIWEVPLFWQSL